MGSDNHGGGDLMIWEGADPAIVSRLQTLENLIQKIDQKIRSLEQNNNHRKRLFITKGKNGIYWIHVIDADKSKAK